MYSLALLFTILAAHPLAEPLDRALVAVPAVGGHLVSWRMLPGDPADLGFNLYAADAAGALTRLNAAPITATSDYWHAGDTPAATYILRATDLGVESGDLDRCVPLAQPYLTLPGFEGGVQKVGLGDLDGDGRLDYVFKSPNRNIDPWHVYWEPSPETYKLHAVSADGEVLWTHDLGWSIERGIWYSPYLVYDFDRDGRAEVALKAGEGDPRDADGKVRSGPEWLLVLDGLTGAERARAPWPDRTGFGDEEAGYNYASRNQLAVAWLDGQRPSILALRGTYNTIKAHAWNLVGDRLEAGWVFESAEPGVRGQGAHFAHIADLDGDGRDEILLGSVVLDDDGTVLWTTGYGHPDHFYIGNLDPSRPGLEVYYGIESRRNDNGLVMVDAATGERLWGIDTPTAHIHSHGMCSDIAPEWPGAEAYGADSADHKPIGERWLHAADGTLLDRELDLGWGHHTAYWDADLQRELIVRGQVVDFDSLGVRAATTGSVLMIADVVGDWREEIVTSTGGEVRIYTTSEPAFDRRTTLLADPIYRADLALLAQGYMQSPSHSANFEAEAPNVNLRVGAGGDPRAVVAVVSAPLDRPLHGLLRLSAGDTTIEPASVMLDLGMGQRRVVTARLAAQADTEVTATMSVGTESWTARAVASGLPSNGEFERVMGDAPAGWRWWSRDNTGGTVSGPGRTGLGAVVSFDGDRDWAWTPDSRQPVTVGQRLVATGWARAEAGRDIELQIAGFDAAGQIVDWRLGTDRASAPFDWREFRAEATIPEGVTQVVVRWIGVERSRVWLDSTRLEVLETTQ
ncbi:MAG TPA: hypothetical protein DCZ72_13680 [Armatimonadetes bacterium]|nr:hypothetical protein [Armatimonadota bacterium]